MPGYEVWTHHDESICQTASVAKENDRIGDDRMDEMFDAIWPNLETNPEDPPTSKVQKFFDILRVLEESLHEHMIVSVLAFVTSLMAIKSTFAFSNNCYKEILNPISNVLANNHKMPKDMYQSKKYCLLSVWSMRRFMRAKITTCFSYKEPKN
jgi:hypothetical protein